jgi:zinc transport system permease protein
MSILNEFINSYFLWRDPMIVGAVTGAVCGFLGVYVVLRRIIFVSATLTQISSFGVALSFYLDLSHCL